MNRGEEPNSMTGNDATHEPEPASKAVVVVKVFDDLAKVDDEFLRQLSTRVHLIDLAYAFGYGDAALRDRLMSIVRPGLAEQVRSAIAMAKVTNERFPVDETVRTSRARVMDIAKRVLGDQL